MIFLKTIQTKKNMNKIFIASSALTLAAAQIAITATTSLAAIPQLNYTCPGKIEVHADQGGPVYINGKEAKLKVFNQNYYEAKGSGVTVSININPDGTAGVSYTGPVRNNGICSEAKAASSNSSSHSSGSHSSTSKAESACLNAVAKRVDLKPSKLSVIDVTGAEAGIGVTIRVPNVKEPWSCLSDKNGKVQGVSYTGSEGDL
jgi:hypothetical protein